MCSQVKNDVKMRHVEHLMLVRADFDRVRASYAALILERRQIQREIFEVEKKFRRLRRVLAK